MDKIMERWISPLLNISHGASLCLKAQTEAAIQLRVSHVASASWSLQLKRERERLAATTPSVSTVVLNATEKKQRVSEY